MELPQVVIKDNFNDFLDGKEVEAAPLHTPQAAFKPGGHVIAFKDSVAATADVPVPQNEMHRTIGIEGTVTSVEPKPGFPAEKLLRLKVKKI